MLAIPKLDGRFLHNRWADPGSDCGRLLGLTPATQRYEGRLCRIEAHEIANPCESCLYPIGRRGAQMGPVAESQGCNSPPHGQRWPEQTRITDLC